jgi:lysophospholipase
LALLSPLLGVRIPVSPFIVGLARFLSVVRPKSRFRKRIDPAYSSRNPAALLRGAQDPLIRQSLTAAWYFAMRSALETVWELAEHIACPLLVLQAGSDLIVDPEAPLAWLERVASTDKTLRILPDHFHELLNELDWANTLADMLDWFEPRVMGYDEGALAQTFPLREIA